MQKPPPKTVPNARSRHRRALLGLILGVCVLYGAGLGATDLWAPDEPRYGAIAEELRSFRHGGSGLVLLHLNDAPYTQKPPLYFWLAAAIGAPLGHVGEIAARLPSAIAGVVGVALTAWIGSLLFARAMPGLLAAAILATSFRFAFSARRAQLDILLVCFELAAIGIFLALESRRGGLEQARGAPLWIAGLHASLGAAALVKGPVGWLPLLVFAVYLAWEGRLPAFRAIAPLWAWSLSLAPLLAWILGAIALAPAGFAAVAVEENLIGRFFSGTSHARPFYYYAIQLPLDFLPWSALLPFALPSLWRWSKRSAAEARPIPDLAASSRFLIVWMLVPLIFFSLSAGKRGLYLLPIFPALALACVLVARVSANTSELSSLAIRRLGIALAIVGCLELIGFTAVLPRLDAEKSPRPIAQAAAASIEPGEALGVYGLSPIEGGLTYYGAGTIASLRDEVGLQRFLADGGRWVLLRRRHFEALGPGLDLVEVEAFRSGRRRLTLARRAD